jgi:predicted TIM-barrel fold metal-dependent hydrolase
MIVDAHIHYGDSVRMNMKTSDLDLLQEMDRNGISKVICAHMEALLYDVDRGNQRAIELCDTSPSRIFAYVTVPSVRLGTSVIPLIERYLEHKSMVGIKMYSVPFPGTDRVWIPLTEPSGAPLLAAIESMKKPLLIHASPEEVELIAKRYPKLIIIMAHAGNAPEMHGQWHYAVHVAKTHKNVILDLCGSTIDADLLRFALQHVEPERILYGSDWPLFRFEYALGRFRNLQLSSADLELMLSGNAERIFSLDN